MSAGELDPRLASPWEISRGELHQVIADHTDPTPRARIKAPAVCPTCEWVATRRQPSCRSWVVAMSLLRHSRPSDWRGDDATQPAPVAGDDAPGLFELGEAS